MIMPFVPAILARLTAAEAWLKIPSGCKNPMQGLKKKIFSTYVVIDRFQGGKVSELNSGR